MTDTTLTLAQIRATNPDADLFEILLAGLGGQYDPERCVSLGDVATISGVASALWCIRALDWSDVAVRRVVIAGAALPAVRRALAHTTDQRVHDCVDAVARWCGGEDGVDLRAEAAADAALAARSEAEAEAARAAEALAGAAAGAAGTVAAAAWAAVYAMVWAAARAAPTEAAGRSAWATEAGLLRDDIVAAFPPVALAGETKR